MLPVPLLADTGQFVVIGLISAVLLVILFFLVMIPTRYKRCPSNRVLVIFGRTAGTQSSRCQHGGGAFVWPLIQDYAFLNLEPIVIEIPLEGALSLNNIRVNVPATFTVAVSTDPVLMNNAAERLLNLTTHQVREQAQDIILGQLRLSIATLSIEEINKDREKFMGLINQNVGEEINKIGLELINVNIRDITDESGYIVAIGKRAAAEAINRAKVEVAQQERDGDVGQATAHRERAVSVAEEQAHAAEGQKRAEQNQRVAVAALEAEAISGEATSSRDLEVAKARREAEKIAEAKKAEQTQRIAVSAAEAEAVTGENTAKEAIAHSEAQLGEIRAEAMRRADVAEAKAREEILNAEREQELAKLGKTEIAPQQIEKQRIEIAAEAEAERNRRVAKGEADAIKARYEAEAEGTFMVLKAKADGYRQMVDACNENPQLAPTLLLIEQLPQLVAEQVKAVQNLKIDKITVWDSGGTDGSRNATTDFLSGMIGSLPKLHELADQAGIELPPALGRISKMTGNDRIPIVGEGTDREGRFEDARTAMTPPPIPEAPSTDAPND